jgi:hypothetical protein
MVVRHGATKATTVALRHNMLSRFARSFSVLSVNLALY